MTRTAWLLCGLLFVVIVGTANSGGYRFGASDQAFYIPALALRADPSLFPRDRVVFEPQMRLWVGDEILGALVRISGIELSALLALLYLATLASLAVAIVWLARSLGCDWWTIAACLILATLRHRIARTGANSLEGYMHPRMLAFALGLASLAWVVWKRPLVAAAFLVGSAVVHSSTALWFAAVLSVAALWPYRQHRMARTAVATIAAAAVIVLAAAIAFLPRMDAAWLAVLDDRDYLFSADWPLYAWVTNLAYPIVLLAIYRRRQTLGAARPGEAGLIAGLVALVAIFVVSIPLAEWHIAFVVQLQANRVFWLLDAVVAIYVAWWFAEDIAARWAPSRRAAVIGLLALLAVTRGAFVLHQTGRPLVQLAPAPDDWMDVMGWLRRQPADWHVLADPWHAQKYGISVRAAALRDTPLEIGKDPAMAMYDRSLAARVADRTAALGDFDAWASADRIHDVDARYDVDVFVDRTDRTFALPVLFRNRTFVVYDLR